MTWRETATAAAIATALSVGVIAQESTMPAQHPMDKRDHKMDAPAAQPGAYIGCVAAGDEMGTFVLRHPMPDVAMADTKMGDMHSGDEMHEPAMAPEAFRLAGSRLKNYAGRTVSVKGALTGGDAAAGHTAPTLKVKSIRVVSGTCSQAD